MDLFRSRFYGKTSTCLCNNFPSSYSLDLYSISSGFFFFFCQEEVIPAYTHLHRSCIPLVISVLFLLHKVINGTMWMMLSSSTAAQTPQPHPCSEISKFGEQSIHLILLGFFSWCLIFFLTFSFCYETLSNILKYLTVNLFSSRFLITVYTTVEQKTYPLFLIALKLLTPFLSKQNYYDFFLIQELWLLIQIKKFWLINQKVNSLKTQSIDGFACRQTDIVVLVMHLL